MSTRNENGTAFADVPAGFTIEIVQGPSGNPRYRWLEFRSGDRGHVYNSHALAAQSARLHAAWAYDHHSFGV